MKKVPPEVLAEIFTRYSGKSVVFPPTYEPSTWTLGHVCSRWRRVLWNFPVIWSNLQLRAPIYNFWREQETFSKESTRQSLDYILSRTNILLSLSSVHEEVAFISDIIILQNHRFRILEFYNIATTTCSLFLDAPSAAFPNLEKFTMVIQGPPLTNASSGLQMAPNLQNFFCHYFTDGPTPQLQFLPSWNKLTDITLRNVIITTRTAHTALNQFPNLVTCRAVLVTDTVVTNTIPIILPRLQSLHLETKSLDLDWGTFLYPFAFPSLTSLRIDSSQILGSLDPFTHLIIRSGCFLEKLALVSGILSSTALQSFELVHHIPDVEVLHLSYMIPASVIRIILGGLCPWLLDVAWTVDPEGFGDIMDWADTCVAQSASQLQNINEKSFCIRILRCLEGPGYSVARRRYLAGGNFYRHWVRFDQGYRYYEDDEQEDGALEVTDENFDETDEKTVLQLDLV
ncbi:hypothetical protein BDZ94DRAFT_1261783 [Collybia nuda]|uniref:F-box domain-containing protein n=1 Tax=Collybia nuda TaxID=64659 RepID=A0A9P5Y6J9_9AGAR|nr:hypothetical protein BDZ94DRAFT_1261783 [Collybia nuda]